MNNKAHLRPQDYDSNGDIIPMSMKEEKGDLISREALKAEFDEKCAGECGVCAYHKWENYGSLNAVSHCLLIDNAPSVPLLDFKEGYRQAIIDGKTNFSKPQGEWIEGGKDVTGQYFYGEFICNKCSVVVDNKSNFCPRCGADMRGANES